MNKIVNYKLCLDFLEVLFIFFDLSLLMSVSRIVFENFEKTIVSCLTFVCRGLSW